MDVKTELRSRLRAARRDVTDTARDAARAAIRRAVLEHCAAREADRSLSRTARIAAYEPLPSEPGSTELLVALHERGYQVIVPVTEPDADLDWATWTDGRRAGPRLGRDAVAGCALLLVPAFAVDPAGHRLGRGGGSYDRALARVPDGTEVAAVLFDGELLAEVPIDEWDRPVNAVVTPAGWRSL